MNNQHDINAFMEHAENKVLVAGYGSLLSQYSRKTYSKINGSGIGIAVKGWERNWITRSISENQTYAGAVPNNNRIISAQLIALEFDDDFEKREQDYRFTQIDLACLDIISPAAKAHQRLLSQLAKTPIYICETLVIEPSTSSFPVNLSYIETCLAGSYELYGDQGVESFFTHTNGWDDSHFNDDRKLHLYPRSTPVNEAPWDIMALLDKAKNKA
jgi:hypothetical protein